MKIVPIGLRAARALGYEKVITYTLKSENGASLKAANFINDGKAGGAAGRCAVRAQAPHGRGASKRGLGDVDRQTKTG